MSDKLSWQEIRKQFPDQWVILVDVDVDQSTNVTAGRVLAHSASKPEMHRRLKEVRQSGGEADAILCTREPHGGIVAALGFARLELK